MRLIARRSPSASPIENPAAAIADVEHLVLEDDDAERVAQRLAQRLVLDRRLEARDRRAALAVLDVRVDGLALDRPGPHERDLHGQVVEVLRLRPQQALHLRAALDLEDADGVGLLDLRVDAGVVERDAREVDRLAAQPRDAVDRVLDRREHPEPEQVDLQEAGVGAAVLVPLADLAARHRGGLHRHEVDQRPGRDDHAARVLADVARQPGDLLRQLAERLPSAGPACVPGTPSSSSPTRVASQPSVTRASRSSSANGRPSALPTSRIAPRLR